MKRDFNKEKIMAKKLHKGKVPGFEIGDSVVLKSTEKYKLMAFEGIEATVIGVFRQVKIITKSGIKLTPRIEIISKTPTNHD